MNVGEEYLLNERKNAEMDIVSGKVETSKPWWRIVGLMRFPDDYHRIKDLWLQHSRNKQTNTAILRAIARAACMAGYQEEGRLLLRRAILLLKIAENMVKIQIDTDKIESLS